MVASDLHWFLEIGDEMNKIISKIRTVSGDMSRSVYCFITSPSDAQIQLMLFVIGITILFAAIASGAVADSEAPGNFNTSRIDYAVVRIFTYLEGSFGVLIMVASGLGAILSSAFGQYRAALGCLVVAVGAFILRSVAATFFNTAGIEEVGGF